jgi:hypothetical protein
MQSSAVESRFIAKATRINVELNQLTKHLRRRELTAKKKPVIISLLRCTNLRLRKIKRGTDL